MQLSCIGKGGAGTEGWECLVLAPCFQELFAGAAWLRPGWNTALAELRRCEVLRKTGEGGTLPQIR